MKVFGTVPVNFAPVSGFPPPPLLSNFTLPRFGGSPNKNLMYVEKCESESEKNSDGTKNDQS